MKTEEVIRLLNEALRHEYQHMHFYMWAANMVTGLHRPEYAEMFRKHALSEFEHVMEFSHKIRGYGGVPESGITALPTFKEHAEGWFNVPRNLLQEALRIEREVVSNYHQLHKMFQEYGDVSLIVFVENQIEHSQEDIDELVQILS